MLTANAQICETIFKILLHPKKCAFLYLFYLLQRHIVFIYLLALCALNILTVVQRLKTC